MPNSWSLKHHVGPSPIQSLGDEAGIGITPRASHMLHFFFFFLKNLRFVATLRQASLPVLFAHSLSLCRMVETLTIVQTFSLLLYLLC